MAKGNLFLGTSRNSVGDVVMYRRDGAQVSRVRVRKVANPKTAAQCLQRAAFAPAAKFFAPFAIVLEKSFEGLSKSKSYSKFLKKAVSLARAESWLLEKGTGFFPLPYQLSDGTVQPTVCLFDGANHHLKLSNIAVGEQYGTIGKISEAFIAAGYTKGDVVTIIGVNAQDIEVNSTFIPMSDQFVIDPDSTVANNVALKHFKFEDSNGTLVVGTNIDFMVAGAVIVSRYQNDAWRRSKQYLMCDATLIGLIQDSEYISDAIASYGNTNADGSPMVYLDGEDA